MWEALRKRLPGGWTAWHSLRIRDQKNFLGEGDFVLAHPQRGLLVLEVKGGQVECRAGRWFSNGAPLDKAPLTQGLDFLSKLLRRLDDWRCAPPAWGAAVAFPDTDVDAQPPHDDLRGVVLGRPQLTWLEESLPSVVERALPPAQAGRGDWMQRLHQLWGETWIPSLSLGTRAREARERRFELDGAQLYALDVLMESDRVLVQGGAGSGKTLIAAEAARRHAALGREVLFLCFTQPLRRWVELRLESAAEVDTMSGFSKRIVEGSGGQVDASDLTSSEVWRAIYEQAMDVAAPAWDVVVVDEAQDLPDEAWFVVEALASGRRLLAFHDPGQGFWKERHPPADLFRLSLPLPRGRRCPPGVEALAKRYLGQPADEGAIARALSDRVLALVPAAAGETARTVGKEIDRLLSDRVRLEDIGVVSLRGQTASDAVHRLSDLGGHTFVHADAADAEERLVADSFLRWKGLERPVIIVADVEPQLKELGTRMHIALTRAVAAARIVAPPAERGWPEVPSPA